ncbi:MAG: glutathione peroxidase [Bacteroidetes bacterium]|nr:glutathione peroxidase [Bacteroidota bacterium]
MNKSRNILLVLFGLLAGFLAYVGISQRNSQMSFRQKILRTLYPALMWITRLSGKNTTVLMRSDIDPQASLYELSVRSLSGDTIRFADYRGRFLLLVNTASDCGYTGQYEALQQLQDRFADRLQVIAFPSNDFKEQEKGTNAEIAGFCQRNYDVRFPIAEKGVVLRQNGQQLVYDWLTDPKKNGWNSLNPQWNFAKFLLDREGRLIRYFGPAVSPLSEDVTMVLEH